MTENSPLTGKVALVTGSASGIGAAIAEALARAGADVVCHGKDDPGEQTVASVRRAGRRSFGIQADLANRDSHSHLIEATVRELGRIDVLVNNAGLIRRAPAELYS